MPDYNWPSPDARRVIGKPHIRIDGYQKSSGKAQYSHDLNRPGMLYAVLVTCPHAHARIKSVDTSQAKSIKGVTAIQLMSGPGTHFQEAMYEGWEIAAVAAITEDIARDAARKVKVEYEVLPHLVVEEDLKQAGGAATPAGEQTTGDPDAAFKQAAVVSEGYYGIPVITHCCLEAHGQVIQWNGGGIEYWPSTQSVSSIGGELGKALEVPAANVHVHMDYIGGGFGSKFTFDRWGEACAQLSKLSGGKPVKLFLDRATELQIAGNRPSHFARIKVAASEDGAITAWHSESWSTGGIQGGGMPPIPYVYRKIPNVSLKHTAVKINTSQSRAWRAPGNPQASYLTCCAFEDLAAKLKMDPLDLFLKNTNLCQARGEVYLWQLQKAAELIEWKRRWHPRGDSGSGAVKRGLGIGINSWGGAGHESNCRTTIHADGSIEVELGSQDLGSGTRTVIAMVAAESLGLPVEAIQVKIGDNKYPPDGSSGGSTTVGGVSSSTRKSTLNALEKLFAAVAPALGVEAAQLQAADGRIQVKGDPSKNLTWSAACRKLGTKSITEMGENNQRNPGGLNTSGAAGVQMADVSVDIETGLVKMNRLVAVQDCGLVINPKTAESQVFGACIMSVCAALYEERIMDQQTGRMLNPNLEFYKLAGLGDIGEIVVFLDTRAEIESRGVVGLGEPPVIGGIPAIANAVANAIGVRVPKVPLTPDRVLDALERRNA
jgi:xanthine dehydrogenase YagR molybdenum-binding subunit